MASIDKLSEALSEWGMNVAKSVLPNVKIPPQSGIGSFMQMLGAHFDEAYARWQVERMHHTSPNGSVHRGEHWTIDQVLAATNKHRNKLPAEVTEWDVYVALNSQWHDYDNWTSSHIDSPELRDMAIIDGAIAFWFADEDYPSPTKVWDYFAKLANS